MRHIVGVLLLVGGSWLMTSCSGSKGESAEKADEPKKSETSAATSLDGLKTAEGKPVKVLQAAEVNTTLQGAQEFEKVPGGGDFVVSGNKRFDGWFLKADRIVFESGASLTFSKQAQANRRQFFVVAKELIVKDANSPGTITWEMGDVPAPPATAGQAPPGPDGPGDNNPGGTGGGGAKGAQGYAGNSAPGLTLIVMSAPSSAPLVEFTGPPAGPGGQGQKGGTGGHGHQGNSGSQNAFNCNRGAGNGGIGGTGGAGGPGGDGGQGGAGGTVTLISRAELLPSLMQKFRAHIAGGRGGDPGVGGPGGDGGPGGPGGAEQRPYCTPGGNPGGPGGTGPTGGPGKTGAIGTEGDLLVGGITDQQFRDYVWNK